MDFGWFGIPDSLAPPLSLWVLRKNSFVSLLTVTAKLPSKEFSYELRSLRADRKKLRRMLYSEDVGTDMASSVSAPLLVLFTS